MTIDLILKQIVIENLEGSYRDFELPPGSSYPLKGVTYPVDYGYIQGYIAEDGVELDVFLGAHENGLLGYIQVDRGSNPAESKVFINVSNKNIDAICAAFKPVLLRQKTLSDAEFIEFVENRRKP